MLFTELISGLWISDVEMLNKTKFLEDNNISIIFNCTQTFDFPKSNSIKKIRLPFSPFRESDTDITLLRNNYKKIVDYISDNIDENNVLYERQLKFINGTREKILKCKKQIINIENYKYIVCVFNFKELYCY